MVQLQNLGYMEDGTTRANIDEVVGKVSYSDWLILYYLAQCMEKKNFVSLITRLADEVSS